MKLLVKNGYLLDPAVGREGQYDLLIEDGIIKEIEKEIECQDAQTLDASGCFVAPGFIDMHVHLRDPGLTYKEDLVTGSKAAARGGFTTILAMGNTKPVMDDPEKIEAFLNRAKEEAPINVMTVGTLTKGMEGNEVTDIPGMKNAGAAALSEDGNTVMDAGIFREALVLAEENDLRVLDHCEDKNLKGKGAMNECSQSRNLNLPGITSAVEDVIVARDILLAAENNAKLHICHCSTKGTVEMIRCAKERGVQVTAEVCPHHFTLSSEDIVNDDPNFKMAPPLRAREDMEALKQGLADGTIDVIASDHAPHSEEEKSGSMRNAAFGIVGLETLLPLTYTELVEKERLTLMQMIERMSTTPAKLLGIGKGTLAKGSCADLVIFNTDESYEIDKNSFASKGRNTPFHGRTVKGKVKATICSGKIVYQE